MSSSIILSFFNFMSTLFPSLSQALIKFVLLKFLNIKIQIPYGWCNFYFHQTDVDVTDNNEQTSLFLILTFHCYMYFVSSSDDSNGSDSVVVGPKVLQNH